jgi:hypothetical protein
MFSLNTYLGSISLVLVQLLRDTVRLQAEIWFNTFSEISEVVADGDKSLLASGHNTTVFSRILDRF